MKRTLALVISLIMVVAFMPTLSTASQENVEFTFLSCWNGGGGGFPSDIPNNPIATKVRELIGVTAIMESITTSETEKLNTMFASGMLPDLTSAPYWSTTGGEGLVIKNAASQGMILDITDLVPNYANVAKLYEIGVAKDFGIFDLNHKDYNGRTYIIPLQTPGDSPDDVMNWAYGAFARGDILDALGIEATSIDTADKLYDFLVKVSEGNFLDTAGKPVIPGGTRHNGWDYGSITNGFGDGYYLSDYRRAEDGTLYHWLFDSKEDDKVKFMRKLVAEGLYDVECFNQTDTQAKEKLATGKYAMFSCHSPAAVDDVMKSTVYATNPEMQYRRLGPFKMKNGDIVTQVEKKGRSGFPVLFISPDTKVADAVLRYIDFANSYEGKLMSLYGIEGETYTLVDGKPAWIPDVKAKFDADPIAFKDFGLNILGGYIGADDRKTLFPKPENEKNQWDKLVESYQAMSPIVFIDKISANYLERTYDKLQEYRDNTSTIDYGAELKRIFFADTEEEALKMLNDVRQRYIDAGINDLISYVDGEIKAYPNPDEIGL